MASGSRDEDAGGDDAAGGLVMPGRRTIGRVLAGLIGVVWFVVLLFAGLGLLFGPMAWLAALVGGARPRLAGVLLGLPVLVLFGATILLLFDRTGRLNIVDAFGIVVVLGAPALVAAALITAPPGTAKGTGR